ncbi:hypothetical protein MMC17_003459 [Xylographa soralifera]|nr:hypothetical protein [Xylographa soralifera]
MTSVAVRSCEPSFRWKALEILMRDCDPNNLRCSTIPDQIIRDDPRITPEIRNRLHVEAEVIYGALGEEFGFVPSPRSSIVNIPSVQAPDLMSPGRWLESPQISPAISSDAQLLSIRIERGSGLHRIHFQSSGLSPDCEHVYYLSPDRVFVYRLGDLSASPTGVVVLSRSPVGPVGSSYRKASLSKRFLAVLKEGPVDSLEVMKYAGGLQDETMVKSEIFEARSNEHRWHPNCVAIHESSGRVWVAVGGLTNLGDAMCGSIRMYRIDVTNTGMELSRHDAIFNRPRPDPLARDFLKMIAFDHRGERLVALTNNNTILVWLLSNNARPIGAPFSIAKNYTSEMNVQGATSATTFTAAASFNPYVLCTTSPSNENHTREMSFISPVASTPMEVPPTLNHPLWKLGNAKAMIAGAASSTGRTIALLEETGKVVIMPLSPQDCRGLEERNATVLNKQLAKQRDTSPTSIRFCESNQQLYLVAVDTGGSVIKKRFGVLTGSQSSSESGWYAPLVFFNNADFYAAQNSLVNRLFATFRS